MIFDIRTSSVSYNTVLYCVIDLIEEAVRKYGATIVYRRYQE